jgi:hypothetical protein
VAAYTNPYTDWAPDGDVSLPDHLYNSLLAQQQSGAGPWNSGLDLDTTLRAMASDLEKSGITNLNQVGWSEKVERPFWAGIEAGGTYGATPGWEDEHGHNEGFGGYAEDDPTMGRWTAGAINKNTGKLLHSGYGERTRGSSWSGTYAGPGNTGFDVNFDAAGNPIFGTHRESSVSRAVKHFGIPLLAGAGMLAAPWLMSALGGLGGGASAEALIGGGASAEALIGGAGADMFGAEAAGSALAAYAGPMSLGWDGVGATGGGDVLGDFIASLGAQEPFTAGAAYTGPMSLGWDGTGATGGGGAFDSVLKAFGLTGADGSMNWLAATKALSSLGSGIYGMNQANAMKQLANQSIAGSSPWTASGGTALAGDALKQTISGNLDKDPGFKLAQANAARASSQNPGGMAATAAANAALKFQNDRIQTLGPAAGVGFSPAAGYQTGLGGVQAGNSLAGSSLASIGYGLTGQGNSAASMPPWLQAYLIQNGIGGTHV